MTFAASFEGLNPSFLEVSSRGSPLPRCPMIDEELHYQLFVSSQLYLANEQALTFFYLHGSFVVIRKKSKVKI